MIFGQSAPKFIYKLGSVKTITADAATDVLTTSSDHTFVVGDRITFSTSGTLPAGPATGTTYYVISVPATDEFKVSATKGGSSVNITDTGSGVHAATAEETVLLDYVRITKDEPEVDELMHQSELTGHREFVDRGDHWVFEVVLNLYKYSDPRSKFEQIYHYRHKNVDLWRHRDGAALADADGNNVSCRIVEIRPFYLEQSTFRDQLLIRFVSRDYVDFSDGSNIIPQLNEIMVID